ncbi:hypothetical protein VPH35_113745 [Triticum aestivum]
MLTWPIRPSKMLAQFVDATHAAVVWSPLSSPTPHLSAAVKLHASPVRTGRVGAHKTRLVSDVRSAGGRCRGRSAGGWGWTRTSTTEDSSVDSCFDADKDGV